MVEANVRHKLTGTLIILGTAYANEYPCPEGTYNSQPQQSNQTSCDLCPPGQYCQGEGLSQPSGNCSAGWFCTGGASQSMPIVIGKCKGIAKGHKTSQVEEFLLIG